MALDLATALPALLPKAVAWANAQSDAALKVGASLSALESVIAQSVGVQHPENIRVAIVDLLPMPDDPELRIAAIESGLLGPNMIGLTLGYAVFLRRGHASTRLLSHEFRHVHQYEAAGSIAAFLPRYLQQIVTFGYFDAPYEVDARTHECD